LLSIHDYIFIVLYIVFQTLSNYNMFESLSTLNVSTFILGYYAIDDFLGREEMEIKSLTTCLWDSNTLSQFKYWWFYR